ncbi:MAG TPA: hypothetical protein VEB59_03895, partial [Gemmatimonadales bacterium]|nr:hypothetical protein [Gemmatimonadales bacterium]
RLSGTGTSGATVRVYIEALELDPRRQQLPAQELLESLIQAADSVGGITSTLSARGPTVVT